MSAGTVPLVRLALRRDRVLVPVWIVVLVAVCYASAAATPGLYADEAERVAAAVAINSSPGIVALYGPILDVHSVGELSMTKMTVLYAVFVAVMALFVVRRHTRTDEEDGQTELLSATAIGRAAPLNAAVAFGSAACLLVGGAAALANTAAGLPFVGSLAFGAMWAGSGLVGVGITALACQLSASSRTCAGIAAGAIGLLFVLRAIGDTTSASFLSWLTPFGWNTRFRAYSGPRWWVLLLYLASAGALLLVARVVHDRRDLGSGVIAQRPGPAVGSGRLGSVLALAVRTHVPILAWWTLACGGMGVLFGAISPSFDSLDSESLRDLIARIGGAGAFRDLLLAAILSVLALVVTCFGITVVGHAARDEQDGRAETVLATATSRAKVFVASLAVALGGATWLLLVVGVGLAVGLGGANDHAFGTLVLAALQHAPAVWIGIMVTAALFAISARAAVLGWAALVLFATLGVIGELLGLPDGVLRLSPYSHVPNMPVESFRWAPMLWLAGIAAALLAAAWARYRIRDIG